MTIPLLPIGARVESVYHDRIVGTIVGYGFIHGYTLGADGEPIEDDAETHAVYLVRMDKTIVDEATDNTFRGARVVTMRADRVLEAKP